MAVLTATLATLGCHPDKPVAQPSEPIDQPSQLNEQGQAGGGTAEQEEIEVADNEVIVARFQEALDAMPRDPVFEREGTKHIEEHFAGAEVAAIRCAETACYVTITAPSPRELLDIRPETLNWGTFAHVVPYPGKLTVFAVLSRGEHPLPAIDLAP